MNPQNIITQEQVSTVISLIQSLLLHHAQNSLLLTQNSSKKRLSPEERKIIAVEAISNGNNSQVGRNHNVSEATVRKCIKSYKDEIEAVEGGQSASKKQTRPRASYFPLTEAKVLEWILEQRTKKLSISMKDIMDMAIKYHAACPPEMQKEFKASRGWFCRFIERNNLTRRTPTHVVQQVKEDVDKQIKAFWQEVLLIRTKVEILRELPPARQTLLLNIDEVPIWLDMTANRTYHIKGARMIEVKKTKGAKMLSTALLGVLSTGYKLPIYWVTKCSQQSCEIPQDIKPYIIPKSNSSGWMDGSLFEDYLKRLVLNLVLPPEIHLILVMDKARIHLTTM